MSADTASPPIEGRRAEKASAICVKRKGLNGAAAPFSSLADASERERQRLGQALHEGLCQDLAGLSFVATVLQRKLRRENHESAGEAQTLCEALSRAMTQARRLVEDFRPATLQSTEFHASLEAIATRSGEWIDCELKVDPIGELTSEVYLQLYRIIEESVANVQRHAGATKMQIRIERHENGLGVSIRDNGCGFDLAALEEAGLGLQVMRCRADKIGAEFHVESIPGSGTTVSCKLSMLK